MKQYNRMILISIIIYLCLSIFSGYAILKIKDNKNHSYRVESNRIMQLLKTEEDMKALSLDKYKYIKGVEYLIPEEKNKNKIQEFYEEKNIGSIQIIPWYEKEKLLGYIKFTYQTSTFNLNQILLLLEGSLLLLEIIVLCFFFYLKRKLLIPFYTLHEMPLQLAKGHFKGSVNVEKNAYLGQFMWGMGQLKDTLDVTKKRELDLMKEKQKLLLSLSHDIKTPLNLIKLYGKALEENLFEKEDEKLQASHQIQEKALEIEKYVEKINQSSREDLFDFTLDIRDFYLKELWNIVMNTYQEQCALRQIELFVHPFENRLIKGDIDRSKEVLENVFENAIKYGDGKYIEVTFYEEDYCQLIRIYNSGEQVNDNELPHLFDSFFRGTNAKGKSGSGLGLYICRELMRKMDGDMFVEKQKDGMSFILVFR